MSSWKKDRNSWLGWFFTVQFGSAIIYFVSVMNNVSQGYLPSMPTWFLPGATCLASVCAMMCLYEWAKGKGQGGGWAFLGIFNLLGIIIGAIILGPMPDIDEQVKPVVQSPVQRQVINQVSTPYPQSPQNAASVPPGKPGEADDFEKRAAALEKYASLKQKGLITEEEYNQQKKKILGL
jgi:hypothetical protein